MMNKKNMKRLTVMLVICTMLMNGIAMFPVSAEEAILPEAAAEEAVSAETAETEEPAAEERAAEEPAAEEPAAEEPAAEEPATDKPAAEEPAAEKTAAGKPAAKKSEAKEAPAAANNAPAAEEPAEDVKEFSVMFANGNAIIYVNPEADEGNIICTMRDGEAIEVCEINQDWYEVKTGGYIMKGSLRYEAEKKIAEEPAVIETKTVTEKATEEKGSDEETPAADVPAAETPAAEDPADKETLTGTPSEDEAEGEQVYTWMLVNGSATIYAKPEAAAENAICEIQDGTPIKACVYDENWYKVKDGYIMKADVCTEAEQPDQDKSPVFSGSTLISEEDIPDDSILIGQILDEMDESRSIDVYISFEGENVSFLDTVTLYAVLRGYDNCTFTVQWQQSPNGNDWTDITGENELKYSFTVTEDNYDLFWRLAVHIVSIEIPDEMLEQAGIQE